MCISKISSIVKEIASQASCLAVVIGQILCIITFTGIHLHNDLKRYLVDDFTRPLKFLESLLAIPTRGPNTKVPSVPKA